jgi:hypothetical protein
MNVDWSVESVDGIGMALVTVELHNPTPVARRVRVENRLAGEILPPRRQGVPERGWDDEGYEGVVAAGDRVALGYACAAPVERPPVDVTDEGRVEDSADEATVETAIRELGDPSPPADVVPLSTDGGDDTDEPAAVILEDSPGDDEADSLDDGDDGDCAMEAPESDDDTSEHPDSSATDARNLPPAVASWLESVERRVEHGEGLTDASVVDAADVLESAGGLDAVVDLPETLTADAATLRTVAASAERLADRADETDVPVDALRRLA